MIKEEDDQLKEIPINKEEEYEVIKNIMKDAEEKNEKEKEN